MNWVFVYRPISPEEEARAKAVAEVVEINTSKIWVIGRLLLQIATTFGSVMLKTYTLNELHPPIICTCLIVRQHAPDELGPGWLGNVQGDPLLVNVLLITPLLNIDKDKF